MKKFIKLRSSKGWIVVLATLIGLTFGGYSFTKNAVSTQVYVTNCGKLDYKPSLIIKFCADAGVLISHIEWSSWSADSAVGKGAYEINDCQPTCVAGKVHHADIEIVLSKSKLIQEKRALSFITIKSKDGKNLPLSNSPIDEWPLELAG